MENKPHTFIQQEDEVAIRQVVQRMQDGQNTRNGKLFASAFAEMHDYVVIDGTLVPNMTREENARGHQALFDGTRSSLGGDLGKVGVELNVSNIRFLTAQITVVHILSHTYPKAHPGMKAKNIMTTVMQKREGKWEIVAFHNSPVQKRNEDSFGFVIKIEGLEGGIQ